MRYCGRDFTSNELEQIRRLIADNPEAHRVQLSRLVCELLDWRNLLGALKEMSCRVAMLRMHREGVITLPAPRTKNANGKRYQRRTLQAEPEFPLDNRIGELKDLHLIIVDNRKLSHLWNEYIDRYHYLGYHPLPGAQIRYLAVNEGRYLAALGFSAAAWKTQPRDKFIGWNESVRQARLHFIVNNSRFLIFPWISVRHLASCLLAMASRRLRDDWQLRYGYKPVLLESFVEIPRFVGTCYKAANWVCVGETKGRGKLDVHHQAALAKKSIWLYPLVKNFRVELLKS